MQCRKDLWLQQKVHGVFIYNILRGVLVGDTQIDDPLQLLTGERPLPLIFPATRPAEVAYATATLQALAINNLILPPGVVPTILTWNPWNTDIPGAIAFIQERLRRLPQELAMVPVAMRMNEERSRRSVLTALLERLQSRVTFAARYEKEYLDPRNAGNGPLRLAINANLTAIYMTELTFLQNKLVGRPIEMVIQLLDAAVKAKENNHQVRDTFYYGQLVASLIAAGFPAPGGVPTWTTALSSVGAFAAMTSHDKKRWTDLVKRYTS